MANDTEKEVLPGLTVADARKIAEQIFIRTDGNHPQLNASENGFMDILENGKPDMSASSAFIRKVSLQ